jgi:hypothetical protein
VLEQTAHNGDGGSNDVLMGDMLRTHEQQIWFLAEHLVETRFVPAWLAFDADSWGCCESWRLHRLSRSLSTAGGNDAA